MGAKSFVTSKAPTSRMKGGLDSIDAGSIYRVGSGKGPRKHKRRPKGVSMEGGTPAVLNAHSLTPAGCKATTVIKAPTKINFTCKVNKQKVVLFEESTYSAEMLEEKEAEAIVNPVKREARKGKVVSRTAGYMANLRTNGRRVNRTTGTVAKGQARTLPAPAPDYVAIERENRRKGNKK